MIMKTKKEHSTWPLLDIIIVVMAWILAITSVYIVAIKLKAFFNHY